MLSTCSSSRSLSIFCPFCCCPCKGCLICHNLCRICIVCCENNRDLGVQAGLGKSDWYYGQLRHFGELFFHLLVYYSRNLSYEAYTFFISRLKIYSKAAHLACIDKYPTQELRDNAELSFHLWHIWRDR